MSDTLMWEVRAAAGRRGELLAWVTEVAVPAVRATAGFRDARVYRGGQDRVVVIAHWRDTAGRLPEPPADLLARPVAQWPFEYHATYSGEPRQR